MNLSRELGKRVVAEILSLPQYTVDGYKLVDVNEVIKIINQDMIKERNAKQN